MRRMVGALLSWMRGPAGPACGGPAAAPAIRLYMGHGKALDDYVLGQRLDVAGLRSFRSALREARVDPGLQLIAGSLLALTVFDLLVALALETDAARAEDLAFWLVGAGTLGHGAAKQKLECAMNAAFVDAF